MSNQGDAPDPPNLNDLPPVPSIAQAQEKVKKHGALDTAKSTFESFKIHSEKMSRDAGTTEQPLGWWMDGFSCGWRLAHNYMTLAANDGVKWPTTIGDAEELGEEVFGAGWPAMKAVIMSWSQKTEHQIVSQQLKEELKRINGHKDETED